METIEYHTIDKTGWGDGPWLAEPDKVQWQDEKTGLPCLIVRGPSGALCGYAGVPEGHPWFGVDYRIGDLGSIDVISGTAMDGPGQFRGFVTIRAVEDNGNVLLGQLPPEEIRAMALRFLEVAEAAEQDRIVFTMMTRDVGLDAEAAAGFVMSMRAEREKPSGA